MKMQLLAFAVVLAASACAKGNDSSGGSSAAPAQSVAAAQSGGGVSDGGKLYQTNCSSCHQATGAGVEQTFPPLAGNPAVTGDPKRLIHAVKFGMSGKLTAMGQNYNGMMPNWGQSLSNADIAEVLTYVRSSWGNKASAITEAEVAAVSQ